MPRTALNRKAFNFRELKFDEVATGTFAGYLAVFNNVDLGDDMVEPGAFSKTLYEAKARQANDAAPFLWPILWQHDEHEPIGGFIDAYEDDYGLYVKGQLDLSTELGRRAYSGMKMGYMRGMSIGYDALKHKWVGNVRHLLELRLYEGSTVTFPMNPDAVVTAVKHDSAPVGAPSGKGPDMNRRRPRAAGTQPHEQAQSQQPTKARDFDTIFQSLAASDQLQDEWGDTFIAFTTAMSQLMWSAHYQADYADADDDTFDPMEAAQANVDAFSKAVMSLVDRSVAADFAPSLDYDGDQFLDPDGINADEGDDDDCGYMSADTSRRSRKEGRTLSADSHALMTKALDMIGAGHKALSDFTKANAPTNTDASAGDSDPKNNGNEPPSVSDNVYDPGFGKSAHFTSSQRRAGLPARQPAASTPTLGAGALAAAVKSATHQQSATNDPSSDDDVARFNALFAEMRQSRVASA